MSTWNIGLNDVSDEAQALKDKLGSKDGQIAAQQTQLMKQAIELEELKSTLNETLHKLSHESDRALQLEAEASQRYEDLRNAKIASQNVQAALDSAHDRFKAKEMETRDLQEILERVSYTSDEHRAHGARLEKEKSILEARVRELDAAVQESKFPTTTSNGSRVFSRPRSSSVSNTKVVVLEKELNDVRARLSGRETELQAITQRLSQIQSQLMKADNEKLAMERKMSERLAELTSLLEEREDELEYLRSGQDDGSREKELLKRIEEDGAKIAALECMMKEMPDIYAKEDLLRRVEHQLEHQVQRTKECEEREIEIIRQKEEALDELDVMKKQIQELITAAQEKEAAIQALSNQTHDVSESVPDGASHPTADDAKLVYIERLLNAIDRLRGERDALRRDVNFLESESRFTIDALEAKLSASSDMSVEMAKSVAALHQSRAEMEQLRARFHKTEELKERDIQRLQLAATASMVLISYMNSRTGELQQEADDHWHTHAEVKTELEMVTSSLDELRMKLKEAEAKLEANTLRLEATASQRDDLLLQLQGNDTVSSETNEDQETRACLAQVESQLIEASQRIEDVESERDSLNLQVKNLTVDLENAQQDLARAERRYTTLQFHQLSAMSDNEATRQLRQQIEELEQRVMRRTEQIGIHQHDIRRLETNLRLQEERLTEMTGDLETLAAQKDAMVEDCADAREARDQAISRVEQLEMDVEMLEARADESDRAVEAMVCIVMQNAGRSRGAVQLTRERIEHLEVEHARVSSAHREVLRLLEEQSSRLADTASKSYQDNRTIQETTIALSISQVALTSARGSVTELERDKRDLQHLIADLRGQIKSRVSETRELSQQLDDLRQKSSEYMAESITRSLELERQIQTLKDASADLETAHRLAIDDLLAAKGGLESRLAEADGLLNRTDLESEISQLRFQHAQEMDRIRIQLEEKTHALEELQVTCTISQGEHDQSLSQSTTLIRDLEGRLAMATEGLEQSEMLNSQLSRLCQEHENNLSRLKVDLENASREAQAAKVSRQEQETSYLHVLGEIKTIKEEHAQELARFGQESSASRHQLEKESKEHQDRIAHQSKELDSLQQELKNLQMQLDESRAGRGRDQKEHIKAIELRQVSYKSD
ncbi:hypothetical protein BD779DRAFT_58463 [Infundibulicybe gibba]|nr:hypothetical protein BD779DRAFT_58463 [Infundibulicybe gibba]